MFRLSSLLKRQDEPGESPKCAANKPLRHMHRSRQVSRASHASVAALQSRRNINQNDGRKKKRCPLCNLKAMAIAVLCWRDKRSDDRCQNGERHMTRESRGETRRRQTDTWHLQSSLMDDFK